jgi:hypothetical protein
MSHSVGVNIDLEERSIKQVEIIMVKYKHTLSFFKHSYQGMKMRYIPRDHIISILDD